MPPCPTSGGSARTTRTPASRASTCSSSPTASVARPAATWRAPRRCRRCAGSTRPVEGDALEALAGGIHRAHDRIAELVEHDPALDGTSTTITSALFDGTRDRGRARRRQSRGYLLRDGDARAAHQDHTFVQSLIDEGRITEEESRIAPAPQPDPAGRRRRARDRARPRSTSTSRPVTASCSAATALPASSTPAARRHPRHRHGRLRGASSWSALRSTPAAPTTSPWSSPRSSRRRTEPRRRRARGRGRGGGRSRVRRGTPRRASSAATAAATPARSSPCPATRTAQTRRRPRGAALRAARPHRGRWRRALAVLLRAGPDRRRRRLRRLQVEPARSTTWRPTVARSRSTAASRPTCPASTVTTSSRPATSRVATLRLPRRAGRRTASGASRSRTRSEIVQNRRTSSHGSADDRRRRRRRTAAAPTAKADRGGAARRRRSSDSRASASTSRHRHRPEPPQRRPRRWRRPTASSCPPGDRGAAVSGRPSAEFVHRKPARCRAVPARLGLAVGIGAYAAVGLGVEGLPADIVGYGGWLAALRHRLPPRGALLRAVRRPRAAARGRRPQRPRARDDLPHRPRHAQITARSGRLRHAAARLDDARRRAVRRSCWSWCATTAACRRSPTPSGFAAHRAAAAPAGPRHSASTINGARIWIARRAAHLPARRAREGAAGRSFFAGYLVAAPRRPRLAGRRVHRHRPAARPRPRPDPRVWLISLGDPGVPARPRLVPAVLRPVRRDALRRDRAAGLARRRRRDVPGRRVPRVRSFGHVAGARRRLAAPVRDPTATVQLVQGLYGMA